MAISGDFSVATDTGGVKVGAQGADYLYGLTNGARLD